MQDNEPYIIGKTRKVRHIRWVRIIIALTLVCVAVMISIIAVASSKKHLRIEKTNYYFVQMGEYFSLADSESKTVSVQNSGGSGYVINDGKFKVMAFVYANLSEAETVTKRLNESGQNAVVYNIGVDEIKLEIVKDNAQNKAVKNAINDARLIFTNLYNIIIQLDKSEISESLALLELNNLKSNLIKARDSLAVFSGQYIAEGLQLLDRVTVPLSINRASGQKVSTYLKYILCQTAVEIVGGLSGFKT